MFADLRARPRALLLAATALSALPSLALADTFVDYANTLKAPGYAIWSLNGGWRAPNGVSLYAEVRNLADERYVSNFSAVTDARAPGVSTAVFFPGEGRSVFGGVSWAF